MDCLSQNPIVILHEDGLMFVFVNIVCFFFPLVDISGTVVKFSNEYISVKMNEIQMFYHYDFF